MILAILEVAGVLLLAGGAACVCAVSATELYCRRQIRRLKQLPLASVHPRGRRPW